MAYYLKTRYHQRSGDVAAWPQVVVEVGTSKSQNEPEEDARFRLSGSQDAVR